MLELDKLEAVDENTSKSSEIVGEAVADEEVEEMLKTDELKRLLVDNVEDWELECELEREPL